MQIKITIDNGTYKWNLSANINDTVFDMVNKHYYATKNDRDTHKMFCENVVGRKLYFEDWKEVPMKQPVKKLFSFNKKNVVKVKHHMVYK